MRLFLDTHVIWWLLSEPERMRRETLAMLTDGRGQPSEPIGPLSMLELAIGRCEKGGSPMTMPCCWAGSRLADGGGSGPPLPQNHPRRQPAAPPWRSFLIG